MRRSGAAAHTLLPGVHRLFSLAKRWLEGTHQGAVRPEHLQSYLDEFIFRFNRRNARRRGLLFCSCGCWNARSKSSPSATETSWPTRPRPGARARVRGNGSGRGR